MILLTIYDINEWHVIGFLSFLAALGIYGIYYIGRTLCALYRWITST
ncbi:hypothetical protein [Bradyrhizobium retamae]|nr:hypothetical protein [Bradyrhizobium retamae]